MSAEEKFDKINLNDIANISEDEFKKQISYWIEERGVSRNLQSKLRADLFEQFNRTNLGRQMAVQHQQTHRIVLSPLILVLNTLVAEFLYTENCHFTLSVFSTEVPYKNTLPNFELTPTKQLFRFSETELNDIFEATGITKRNEETIRKFYSNNFLDDGTSAFNKSLLYCIFKTVFDNSTQHKNSIDNELKTVKPKLKDVSESMAKATAAETSAKCTRCSSSQNEFKRFQISSRYFKYLNRYLDILSERVCEMSKSLAQIHENPLKKIKSKSEVNSTGIENNLKKSLNKIIESLSQLTKSKRKSKKFQDVLNSFERLSVSLEKCGGSLESLIVLTSTSLQQQHRNVTPVAQMISACEKNDQEIDYSTWLRDLRTSNNGKKFVERLELSLQKTIDKERENLEKACEEKIRNYKMLMKLHYKQKFGDNTSQPERAVVRQEPNVVDETQKLISNELAMRANEKELYVDQIVQSAKARLQQLENEGEKLDESFQAYLKRQHTDKNQLNEDLSKIWQNYNFGKSILGQHNLLSVQCLSLKEQQKTALPLYSNSSTKDLTAYQADINKQLNDVNKIRSFENPFKKFSPADLFSDKRALKSATSFDLKRASKSSSSQTINYLNQNADENENKSIIKITDKTDRSSDSSYEQFPSALKKNNEDFHLDRDNLKENAVNKIISDSFDLKENNQKESEIRKSALLSGGESIDKNLNVKLMSEQKCEVSSENKPVTVEKIVINNNDNNKTNLANGISADTFDAPIQTISSDVVDNNMNRPKLSTFVPVHTSSSASETEEIQQISIGPAKNSSSPEDFWN